MRSYGLLWRVFVAVQEYFDIYRLWYGIFHITCNINPRPILALWLSVLGLIWESRVDFNAPFFIFVRTDRFQKPCSLIWDMMQCHVISTFLLHVFRDIILIQLHFSYNNTRWFNLWFIKECHHNKHFPCFLRNPFW